MGGEHKIYTLAEVSQHNNSKDCWLVIDGKVYNVTKFLNDHLGGDDVLLSVTGKDASDDFEDVGHSKSARKMLEDMYIGGIDSGTLASKNTINKDTPPPLPPNPKQPQSLSTNQDKTTEFITKMLQFLVPLIILGFALGVRFYTKPT